MPIIGSAEHSIAEPLAFGTRTTAKLQLICIWQLQLRINLVRDSMVVYQLSVVVETAGLALHNEEPKRIFRLLDQTGANLWIDLRACANRLQRGLMPAPQAPQRRRSFFGDFVFEGGESRTKGIRRDERGSERGLSPRFYPAFARVFKTSWPNPPVRNTLQANSSNAVRAALEGRPPTPLLATPVGQHQPVWCRRDRGGRRDTPRSDGRQAGPRLRCHHLRHRLCAPPRP